MCRKSFIDLHSQAILEDLRDFFLSHYIDDGSPDHEYIAAVINSIPPFGNFDLNTVEQSEYFFSWLPSQCSAILLLLTEDFHVLPLCVNLYVIIAFAVS